MKRRARRLPVASLLLAGGMFLGLVIFMRSLERSALQAALVDDQVDGAGRARPLAEVAQAVRSMKLVTVEVATKVTSESGHDSWRGGVDARVTAPVRLLYGADLSRMESNSVAFSGVERTWLIRVPMPERIATEVCTDSEQAEVQVGWMRLRSRAGEYYLGLARHDLSERARAMTLSREDAEFVRKTTREQVEGLVKRIAGDGAKVVVEFDDRREVAGDGRAAVPAVRAGGTPAPQVSAQEKGP